MPTLPSPTAWRLDRLDDQASRLRAASLEMMVAVSVPTPDLRSRAFKACVEAGRHPGRDQTDGGDHEALDRPQEWQRQRSAHPGGA